MLNWTVELIALWASSSPSLLAFCFSHLIIAVLFLGGRGGCASELDTDGDSRGEWTSEGAQAEPLRGVQVHGGGKSNGGQKGPAAATNISADRGRAGECVAGEGEVDAAAVQLEASGKDSGGDGESIAADASSQEKGGGVAEEDELMVRAEEFIQRMNRAWRTENVRLC